MLYILVGLPATGKSEVAKILSRKNRAVVLSEDEILRELYPKPTHSAKERQRVYEEMFVRARKLLKSGKEAVLDATFIKKSNREKASSLAKSAGVDYRLIEVTAPEEQIKQRLRKRYHREGNDADWSVYLKYKKGFEPIFERHRVFNNSGNLAEIRKQLEKGQKST